MHHLYLDSMVFIRAVEGRAADQDAACARAIILEVEKQQVSACTSELTLAEVLTGPHAAEAKIDPLLKRTYLELIVWKGLIELVPLTREDMYEAAALAAVVPRKVRLPDRLHLATSIRIGASHFVSHDSRIPGANRMRRVDLSPEGLNLVVTPDE
ncbi:hypothetical protein GCM10011316_19900 [Roseibium aquae]|uniref:PIN domain-containing protein n=1 Tax=Roseibium aquae TaxID=1323746 RepID=A0A916X1S1_9HYPH|nr:type II toxin-antitoxin system VapC family toxin [Roseibium aquae]GGB47768.1 hypothetical protein GCM10011316_19900 [Roseibium aquae]